MNIHRSTLNKRVDRLPHQHYTKFTSIYWSYPVSTINLRPKKLTIYKRPKSPLWQCRYKLDKGEWYRQSTGTDDQAEAEDIAFKLYYGADERDKNNLPQNTH